MNQIKKKEIQPESYRITLPEFRLISGIELKNPQAQIHTIGQAIDRTILICHAFSSSSDLQAWWPEVLGNFDLSKDQIITINTLGSCHGSVGPESVNPVTSERYLDNFPSYTMQDQAEFTFQVLAKIGITKLDIALGFSMGGMQLLGMLELHPRLAKKFIIGAASTLPEMCKSMNALEMQILRQGNFSKEAQGQARKLLRLRCASILGIENLAAKLNSQGMTVDDYLEADACGYIKEFSPYCHDQLMDAMNRFILKSDYPIEHFSSDQSVHLFGIPNDIFTPASAIKNIASRLRKHPIEVSYETIASQFGHESWLIEANKFCNSIAKYC